MSNDDSVFTTSDLPGPRVAPDGPSIGDGPTIALTKQEQLRADLKDAIARGDAKVVRQIERRIERLEVEAKASQRRREIETELAEEARVEERRQKRLAADAAESLVRNGFAPIVLIQYAGRAVRIRLGHKDGAARRTALAALQRILAFVDARHEEHAVLSRNWAPLDPPDPVDHTKWVEQVLARSDLALAADKFGSIQVEK